MCFVNEQWRVVLMADIGDCCDVEVDTVVVRRGDHDEFNIVEGEQLFDLLHVDRTVRVFGKVGDRLEIDWDCTREDQSHEYSFVTLPMDKDLLTRFYERTEDGVDAHR